MAKVSIPTLDSELEATAKPFSFNLAGMNPRQQMKLTEELPAEFTSNLGYKKPLAAGEVWAVRKALAEYVEYANAARLERRMRAILTQSAAALTEIINQGIELDHIKVDWLHKGVILRVLTRKEEANIIAVIREVAVLADAKRAERILEKPVVVDNTIDDSDTPDSPAADNVAELGSRRRHPTGEASERIEESDDDDDEGSTKGKTPGTVRRPTRSRAAG